MSPSTPQMQNLAERPDAHKARVSRATPRMRNLAERVIAHEKRERESSGTKSPATFPIVEKLRQPLAALVGSTGFSALLSRALALASREVPRLRALRVKADGSLEGQAELEAQVGPEKIAEGRVALLAHLFELLRTFIGENLTMQLMREVWPKLFLDDSYLGGGGGNEKEK